ncbi:hypothetical protein AQ490_21995 [Wenjunlia vitaminophila]|uniref:Nudix hydrolase domain-containing protein n=1 Tax=Wenjunlia vitaminophila TaxID=76728 RepID=A0A0T6LSF1_WENVI|nr:NUDIX hydrolase [Wenjunlia vitaminophila]KRV48992.1 hypothetical protein AQ490_21995 [Wenjunlia vitaminophila]
MTSIHTVPSPADGDTVHPGPDPDLARYLARHPAPAAAVDALIRDEQGRLLIVDPSYKAGWDVPGGMLDDEELHVGLCRELEEELQVSNVRVGRLLAVDSIPRSVYGRSLIACVFAVRLAEPVAAEHLVLQADEIRAAAYLPEAEALARLPGGLRRRVAAAVDAERGAHTAYLCDGRPLNAG